MIRARPAREFLVDGVPILNLPLAFRGFSSHLESDELSEYPAPTKWIRVVSRFDEKRKRNFGLYTTIHVRASLDGQPKTINFLEEKLQINLRALVA